MVNKKVKKAFETKVKNKTFKKSKPEDLLYKILIRNYKRKNIVRQKLINNQHVDFYIITLDLYIQVDGIYWHGLNKSAQELKNSDKLQYQKIYQQTLKDKKLNTYFKAKKLKLLRISDLQVKQLSELDIVKHIDKTKSVKLVY